MISHQAAGSHDLAGQVPSPLRQRHGLTQMISGWVCPQAHPRHLCAVKSLLETGEKYLSFRGSAWHNHRCLPPCQAVADLLGCPDLVTLRLVHYSSPDATLCQVSVLRTAGCWGPAQPCGHLRNRPISSFMLPPHQASTSVLSCSRIQLEMGACLEIRLILAIFAGRLAYHSPCLIYSLSGP